MYKLGTVVGKFCPLHLGHQLVIETALKKCEKVVILSYTSRDLGYTATLREAWLRCLYPQCEIHVLDKENPPDDFASDLSHRTFCAEAYRRFNAIPDVVFSSESYGPGFAQFLSQFFQKEVAHSMVDLKRIKVPISGTELRVDLEAWHYFVSPQIKDLYASSNHRC